MISDSANLDKMFLNIIDKFCLRLVFGYVGVQVWVVVRSAGPSCSNIG